MSLILAIIWFLAGVYFFVNAWINPEVPLGVLPGFIALVLCGYNILKWWLHRRLKAGPPAETVKPLARRPRSAESMEHLFKLEDEPIHLPPPDNPSSTKE